MGIVKCVVPGCEDRRSPRHRFPVFDQELYEEWLKRVGNVELLNLDPKYVGSNKRICSVHFSSHCRVPNSTKLKNRSLPTLQLPEFKEKPTEDNSILKYPCKTQTILRTERNRSGESKRIAEDAKPILDHSIDRSQSIDQVFPELNLIDPIASGLTDTKTIPDAGPFENTSATGDEGVIKMEPQDQILL
uniref:THAP domain-containing protein 3 n=1 Tax=Lygus hesperus TaxID=30085 RepID=A0A0A9X8C3_LYGHE